MPGFGGGGGSPWGNAPPAIADWLNTNWGGSNQDWESNDSANLPQGRFQRMLMNGRRALGARPGGGGGQFDQIKSWVNSNPQLLQQLQGLFGSPPPGGPAAAPPAPVAAPAAAPVGGAPAGTVPWAPPTKSASWKPGMSQVPTRQLLSGRTPLGAMPAAIPAGGAVPYGFASGGASGFNVGGAPAGLMGPIVPAPTGGAPSSSMTQQMMYNPATRAWTDASGNPIIGPAGLPPLGNNPPFANMNTAAPANSPIAALLARLGQNVGTGMPMPPTAT